jgi:uncharacterized membrane protein YkoI
LLKKRLLVGTSIAAVLTGMLFLGSLALDPVFAQTQPASSPTQAVAQGPNNGSATVDEAQYSEDDLKDIAAALQNNATITSAQAEAAALSANPGTTVAKTELDNENGVLVYSVELSNGMDVKVDAGSGKVLQTEQAGNDTTEVAGAENTLEQEAVED